MNSDFTVDLASDNVTVHSVDHEDDWEVTLAYTGRADHDRRPRRTGRRAVSGRCEYFAVTYGDGVTDADLTAELEFHCAHGKIGTVLGVNPPSRFGELKIEGERVSEFEEKPEFEENWINGGYFFFRRTFLHYLPPRTSLHPGARPAQDLARTASWRCSGTRVSGTAWIPSGTGTT